LNTLRCAVLLALFAVPCLHAWNYAGHLAVAYIAYNRLTPPVRARVDSIIRKHPDYVRWIKDVPAERRGLEAFMQAAAWADSIRGDERFWEPGSSNKSTPTPPLPGFPDMEVHGNWHYRDLPLSVPGAPAPPPEVPNALLKMRQFVAALDEPYNLVWFLHLVGDTHQPLHAVSRFLKPGDTGDRGGNDVLLDHPAKNLHAFWDNVVSRDRDMAAIQTVAKGLLQAAPSGTAVSNLDFESWFLESFEVSVNVVYKLEGSKITQEYDTRAIQVGRERVSLAGYRLAAVLNDRLQ
jgi:hypothetical protein